MGPKRDAVTRGAEQTVRDFRSAARRKFSAEEKIRIVLEGLRGEDSIAELSRKEGIVSTPPDFDPRQLSTIDPST